MHFAQHLPLPRHPFTLRPPIAALVCTPTPAMFSTTLLPVMATPSLPASPQNVPKELLCVHVSLVLCLACSRHGGRRGRPLLGHCGRCPIGRVSLVVAPPSLPSTLVPSCTGSSVSPQEPRFFIHSARMSFVSPFPHYTLVAKSALL